MQRGKWNDLKQCSTNTGHHGPDVCGAVTKSLMNEDATGASMASERSTGAQLLEDPTRNSDPIAQPSIAAGQLSDDAIVHTSREAGQRLLETCLFCASSR